MSTAARIPCCVVRRGEVSSTNDVARSLAADGAAAWTMVLAESQSAGRGRQGRTWTSPAGNLYSTLILRPGRAMAEWPSLSLVVALAIRDAACRWLAPDRVRLKWPNDVLVDGRKISGVLLETVSAGAGPAVLVGTGVNVVSAPPGATFLADHTGAAPALGAVAEAYAEAMAARVGVWEDRGFADLRSEWLAAAAHRGESVLVRNGTRVEEGRLVDLDPDGTLVIEGGDGRSRRLAAGDLLSGSAG